MTNLTQGHDKTDRRFLRCVSVLIVCMFFAAAGSFAEEQQNTSTKLNSESLSLEQSTGSISDVSPQQYREILQVAVQSVKQGNYAQAIEALEPYRAKDDFALLHALGIAYLRSERNIEAYTTLIRAHQVHPDDPAPLLPAALACARMARTCLNYRELALEYKARGGKLVRMADKIANYHPVTLSINK